MHRFVVVSRHLADENLKAAERTFEGLVGPLAQDVAHRPAGAAQANPRRVTRLGATHPDLVAVARRNCRTRQLMRERFAAKS